MDTCTTLLDWKTPTHRNNVPTKFQQVGSKSLLVRASHFVCPPLQPWVHLAAQFSPAQLQLLLSNTTFTVTVYGHVVLLLTFLFLPLCRGMVHWSTDCKGCVPSRRRLRCFQPPLPPLSMTMAFPSTMRATHFLSDLVMPLWLAVVGVSNCHHPGPPPPLHIRILSSHF